MTPWILLTGLFLAILAFEIGFLQRLQPLSFKQSIVRTSGYVGLALIFNIYILLTKGTTAGGQFFAAYILEQTLSIDNMFVFVLIFNTFKVSERDQQRVLLLGILSALVMRAIFIYLGSYLVTKAQWTLAVFGFILILTSFKILLLGGKPKPIEDQRFYKFLRANLPLTKGKHPGRFLVMLKNGDYKFTPLFLVLLMIEATDLIFAVDSIPAVFGITQDPFIVYSSNIFALMGLRSLFNLLDFMIDRFKNLKIGVAIVLLFIGSKMVIHHGFGYHLICNTASIVIILSILGGSVLINPGKR